MDIRNGKIIMPTIYVPTWTEMYTQAGVGLRGEMEWELFERHNGKEVAVRRGKQRNLIMDAGIDFWFNNWTVTNENSKLYQSAKKYMAVGTGTTAPAVSQTTLAAQLGNRNQWIAYPSIAPTGAVPYYCSIVYEFQEDQVNGDLTEWGLFSAAIDGSMWCRELFRDENGDPVVVTKTDTQALRFTYKLYINRTADSSTSVITADGVEYTCITTINDKQLEVSFTEYFNNTLGTSYPVSLGTSNAKSDLVNDSKSTIKGELIANISRAQCVSTLMNYAAGSFKRSVSISIGGSYGNGNIGEAVFGRNTSVSAEFCRVTYDPPIEKTASKKLYLGIEFSLAGA